MFLYSSSLSSVVQNENSKMNLRMLQYAKAV